MTQETDDNNDRLDHLEQQGICLEMFYYVPCRHCLGAGRVMSEYFAYDSMQSSGFNRSESWETCPECRGTRVQQIAGEDLTDEEVDYVKGE